MMSDLAVGRIYEKIGEILETRLRLRSAEALLYATAGDQWAGAAIFQDGGDKILYCDPNLEMTDAILEAWEAEDEDQRWAEMYYRLLNDRFFVKKVFSREIDPLEDELDRRDRIVRERFGDKPIDYSDP